MLALPLFCDMVVFWQVLVIYIHSSRIYWLRLPCDLNVDFWWFLELWAQEWLDYDLIMYLAMIICYRRGLVIFLEILCGFGQIYGLSGLIA